MQKIIQAITLTAALFLLAACSDSTADIVVKASDADTTAQLTAAIGKPDSIEKIGPLARWIY